MEKFEIGEIAIYVRPGSSYYGEEVTILSGLRPRKDGMDFVTGEYQILVNYLVYEISEPAERFTGPQRVAKPEWLRKKPKRRECDKIVSWDSMPWRPKETVNPFDFG